MKARDKDLDENKERKKLLNYSKAFGLISLTKKRVKMSPYAERYDSDEVVYLSYAGRAVPLTNGIDPLEGYRKLREGVALFDVPEKPLSIKGPDAGKFMDKIFTRNASLMKPMKALYALACLPNGGILMDGIIIRLAEDHFWYIQADGEFQVWLDAHSNDYQVNIEDPKSHVLQIQGPKALEVLSRASGVPMDETLRYFNASYFTIGGQKVLISRTGWTGEVGVEVYGHEGLDHLALWDSFFEAGKPFDLSWHAADAMGTRRLEAGILDNGTDIDRGLTPFTAGLEKFVDFQNHSFIGRSALLNSNQKRLLYGIMADSVIPTSNFKVYNNSKIVGKITAGDWSPELKCGIGYVRFEGHNELSEGWLNEKVMIQDNEKCLHEAKVVELPFFDKGKDIPKGVKVL